MKRKSLVAAITVASLLVPTAVAHAAPSQVTGVELGVPAENFIQVEGTVNLNDANTIGLPALKELRAKAWDENPPFRGYGYETWYKDGTRLQDVAKRNGIHTKEQYLDIYTDADLTWIAVQRAAENSVLWGHTRPGGFGHTSATRGSIVPASESLTGGHSLEASILEQWGEEEIKLLWDFGGVFNEETGHAIHVLHPQHKVWGFGHVRVPGSRWKQYAAAVHSYMSPAARNTAELPDREQTLIFDVAQKPEEKEPEETTTPQQPEPEETTTPQEPEPEETTTPQEPEQEPEVDEPVEPQPEDPEDPEDPEAKNPEAEPKDPEAEETQPTETQPTETQKPSENKKPENTSLSSGGSLDKGSSTSPFAVIVGLFSGLILGGLVGLLMKMLRR